MDGLDSRYILVWRQAEENIMRKIVLLLLVLFATSATAHNTGRHEAAAGGPCWVWEVPVTPIYCIFVHGTRKDHPYPEWLEDLPSSDV